MCCVAIVQIIKRLDVDGDGTVDRDEFSQAVATQPVLYDCFCNSGALPGRDDAKAVLKELKRVNTKEFTIDNCYKVQHYVRLIWFRTSLLISIWFGRVKQMLEEVRGKTEVRVNEARVKQLFTLYFSLPTDGNYPPPPFHLVDGMHQRVTVHVAHLFMLQLRLTRRYTSSLL